MDGTGPHGGRGERGEWGEWGYRGGQSDGGDDGPVRPEDIQVYTSLLPRLPGPADDVPPESLRRLVAYGLLYRDNDGNGGDRAGGADGSGSADGATYLPVNPGLVCGRRARAILGEAQEALDRLVRSQETLAPAVEAYRHYRDLGDYEVHSGLSRINAAIELATRECHEEILTSQPGGPRSAEVLASSLPPTLAMLARGARMKTIYQHNARTSAATRAYVRTVEEHGAEVRTLDENFDRLIIFDRKVAFIPSAADRTVAVEIRIPAVVSFLVGSFERSWMRAVPFTPPGRDKVTARITDELELAILRHVVAGDKDAVTAQQLGISVRRCQEYIARLSARFGSRSRAQLGYLIAKSGVLEGSGQGEEASGAVPEPVQVPRLSALSSASASD
ncbi:LuxR family transcriptional regulator [Streptomyces sp. CC219B]|uniref:LuxR family transcriptional regulator n=1 Tax=Streptomyces sp. CC219B TaxID=3044574 RepID=UPI0024A87BEB|nr:LuxR family transcriptional regulator [Streptomyces sp. CC219B]